MSTPRQQITSVLADLQRPGIDDLIGYLTASDFFTAPASTRFHGAFSGGLAAHSWNVYSIFREKVRTFSIDLPDDSTALCGLLHDVCKIGVYTKGTRNVKENGEWVSKEVWQFSDPFPYGHGEKSVYILQKFLTLTDTEAITIRWHMGFSEPKELYHTLGDAAARYPSVTALHTADLEAAQFLEPRGD